jgi:hypothetical protein
MIANQNSVDIEMSVSLEKLHDFLKTVVLIWVILYWSCERASGLQESRDAT